MALTWLSIGLSAVVLGLITALTTLQKGIGAIEFISDRVRRYTSKIRGIKGKWDSEIRMTKEEQDLHNALARVLGEIDAEKELARKNNLPHPESYSKFLLSTAAFFILTSSKAKAKAGWKIPITTFAKALLAGTIASITIALFLLSAFVTKYTLQTHTDSNLASVKSTRKTKTNSNASKKLPQSSSRQLEHDKKAVCPDGSCSAAEDCHSCPQDCGNCTPNESDKDTPSLGLKSIDRDFICEQQSACKACFDINSGGYGVCRTEAHNLSQLQLSTVIKWSASGRDRHKTEDPNILANSARMAEEFINSDNFEKLDDLKSAIVKPDQHGFFEIQGIEVRINGGHGNGACWGGLKDFIWEERTGAPAPPICCVGAACAGADYLCSGKPIGDLIRTCIPAG